MICHPHIQLKLFKVPYYLGRRHSRERFDDANHIVLNIDAFESNQQCYFVS